MNKLRHPDNFLRLKHLRYNRLCTGNLFLNWLHALIMNAICGLQYLVKLVFRGDKLAVVSCPFGSQIVIVRYLSVLFLGLLFSRQ